MKIIHYRKNAARILGESLQMLTDVASNKLLLVVLISLLCMQHVVAAQYKAEVVRILDGDTVEVINSEKKILRIRLANIDAPERHQAFGEKSRQALAAMTYRKNVTVVDQGGDLYGRVIAVLLKDGVDINAEMVKQGMAWVYTRYNNNNSLPFLQNQAKKARVGLWVDSNPVAPWEFRHAQ